MTLLQSILLGILQGLTEFLPISSSGHLVLVPYLLNWDIPASDAFVFDVLVQVATLLAVFVYFWNDLLAIGKAFILGLVRRAPFEEPQARLGWLILLATLPAGLIGLLLKDAVEQAFASPLATALSLLVTAALLLVAERAGRRSRDLHNLIWLDAVWIGLAQALAIFPGISRSGATITGGMTRNLSRPEAARFSFLLSIPIMLAAGLLAVKDLLEIPSFTHLLPVYLPGFLAAALAGYLSIRWLLGFLTHRPLYIFSAYCTLLALLSLVVVYLR
ncbi:MAG: undecaprenyl-diphosphatase UppP [Chloroflexota bacterium]